MGQDERTSIWDDEDELRRMILEAEENEIWRIEESDGDDEDAQAPDSDLLKLRMKLDSGAAAADGSGENK